MPVSTVESLSRPFQVTRPTNLDLPSIHGNDYSKINLRPETLWNYWGRENAILGRIAGTEVRPWEATYPGVQYVQNKPESVHMVIAPRRDSFVSPTDLDIDDTAHAAAFMQRFMEPRGKHTFAGYNIGPEEGGSQMWWSWHVHLVQFGENELQDLASKPRILWEPWPAQVQEVMGDVFVNDLQAMEGVPLAERTDLSDLDRFGFSSYGSSLLRFSPDISAHELATVMHHADVAYKKFHGEIKEIFYEQIDGRYVKREPEDMSFLLKEYSDKNCLTDETTQTLATLGGKVLPSILPEKPTQNSPLTGPNYSVAIMNDETGTYFLFQPHIFRKKASALSSLGIYLDYTLDTDPARVDDYLQKKAKDTELVREINASLQVQSATALKI